MRRLLIPLALLVVAAVLAVWLWRAPDTAQTQAPVVLAASSLQEALEDAATAWAAQGHARPVLSFAATSALARQIAAGAPADVFISADEAWMDDLAAKGLLRSGTRAPLAGNRLVLIAPAGSPTRLTMAKGVPLAAAVGQGRLAMAVPAAVPAGRYARQALESLGVWQAIAGRVTASDNVRAALALVAQGEAPLGIVYATDAVAEPRVRVVATFPAASHTAITYPVAVLSASKGDGAEGFRRYLLSPQGQAAFARHGFSPPTR